MGITLGLLLGLSLAGTLHAAPPTRDADRSSLLSVFSAAVADEQTGAPLRDAEVVLVELRRVARTNWLGEAFIAGVAPGTYRVRVRRIGYAPADVRVKVEGDTSGMVFMLEPSANPLDTIRVVARRPFSKLEGFERRRAMGFGRFLTEADLVVEGDRELSFVIAGRIPGIRRERVPNTNVEVIYSTRGSCGVWSSTPGGSEGTARTERGSVRSSCLNPGPCKVRVLLDEMDVSDDVNFLARTWDLAGVEYYSAASVPVQYRDGRAGCGLLLLWSRY